MREAVFLLTLPIVSVQVLFFVKGFLLHLWAPLIPHCLALHGPEVLLMLGSYAVLVSAGSLATLPL
jgi:hypothetical protein